MKTLNIQIKIMDGEDAAKAARRLFKTFQTMGVVANWESSTIDNKEIPMEVLGI